MDLESKIMKPYYSHDGITIYCGDCREILAALPKVDLVLTDVPYGTGWVRGGGKVGEFTAKHDKPAWDVWDIAWIGGVKSAAWAVFCPLNRAPELTFPKATTLYYRKTNPRPGGPTREAIVCAPTPWRMDRWEYAAYNGDCPMHPCQKPMDLMVWLVDGMSDAGSLILDPYMGSGTTLVAAKRLGRQCIGIEIEEKYCEIAARRVEAERLTLFEYAEEQTGDLFATAGHGRS